MHCDSQRYEQFEFSSFIVVFLQKFQEDDYNTHKRTRAQESSGAIERLYITMRHLFNRGFYKPMGVSGETLRESLTDS